MERSVHLLVAVLLVISQLCSGFALESTGASFMWSPHINMETTEKVNYETLSYKDLAKVVMDEGGWSNILCGGEQPNQMLDVAVVFVGNELHSSDISRKNVGDASLTNLLKDAFVKNNFSMAYPYVLAKTEDGRLVSSLVEEFEELCEKKLGVNNIVVSESCLVKDKGYSKFADVQSMQDYVASAMKKDVKGDPDLIVFCQGGFNTQEKLDQPQSEVTCDEVKDGADNVKDTAHTLKDEGVILSELTSSLDNSGAKYAFLYVSDPYNPIKYPSSHQIGRLLTEATSKNGSLNSTYCDEVCQLKTSLLEGVFVAIVLLIILISGLCCMMGIDTPTRFEAPLESS